MTQFTMGIDQHGQHYDDLGEHPRKELLERLSCKSAAKIYTDKLDGTSWHTGYIIKNLWITIYYLQPMENKA
jgi:hypothetical protein